MTSLTPAAILAKAMKAAALADRGAFSTIIRKAGVDADVARRAATGANGHPTPAGDHINLCIVLGIDPLTGNKLPEPREPAPFLSGMLAIGIKVTRDTREHSLRRAAGIMGISPSTLTRIEKGWHVAGFDSVAAACKYVGLHPFAYLAPESVSRETRHETLAA